jgi:predicted phosphodiesterase
MNKQDLLKICIKKRNKKINLSWNDINEKYSSFKNGESLRNWVKQQLREQNLLPKIIPDNNNIKILHISDQHYPFNLPIEIFSEYVGKVDVLVINGDEEDCQSISKFNKKYRVNFVDEMIGTRKMLIDIIEYIKPKKVIFNYGNHNIRIGTYLSDKLHDDIMQLMPETNLDMIIDMGFYKHDHKNKTRTYYEPLSKIFDEKYKIIYTKNWFCQVGKTIFAHPKAYKQGILGTTEKAYNYFCQKRMNFDALILAHTHQIGFTKYGETYLFESGSLCKEPSYATDGNMTKPQSNGFIYLEQNNNGDLVYDNCKVVCI